MSLGVGGHLHRPGERLSFAEARRVERIIVEELDAIGLVGLTVQHTLDHGPRGGRDHGEVLQPVGALVHVERIVGGDAVIVAQFDAQSAAVIDAVLRDLDALRGRGPEIPQQDAVAVVVGDGVRADRDPGGVLNPDPVTGIAQVVPARVGADVVALDDDVDRFRCFEEALRNLDPVAVSRRGGDDVGLTGVQAADPVPRAAEAKPVPTVAQRHRPCDVGADEIALHHVIIRREGDIQSAKVIGRDDVGLAEAGAADHHVVRIDREASSSVAQRLRSRDVGPDEVALHHSARRFLCDEQARSGIARDQVAIFRVRPPDHRVGPGDLKPLAVGHGDDAGGIGAEEAPLDAHAFGKREEGRP